MPKLVQTQLGESEYELLKDFKEKNGLKTDYQGLKELVKALDIPEFHEEIKTEEKKEVKTEVKPIDRTNLENWVRDLSFQQPTLSPIKRNSIMELADMSGQLADKIRDTSTRSTTSYGDLQQMIVLLGRNVDMMMKELTGKSIKIAL